MLPTLEELGLHQLTVDEKIELAQVLVESIAHETQDDELTESQIAELDRRIAHAKARPDAVTPWEVVKANALARAKR